jgi:hypothetical protein
LANRRISTTSANGVEEPDELGHDDLVRLAAQVRAEGLPVEFAYDTLVVEIWNSGPQFGYGRPMGPSSGRFNSSPGSGGAPVAPW